jgi:hypothetical protein
MKKKKDKKTSEAIFKFLLFAIMMLPILIPFLAAFKSQEQTTTLTTMSPTIKLSYFDIEGAAEPTRLALILTGTAFEDDRVSFEQWGALKPTTPYGSLPIMTVDGVLHTESAAMLRWVGATFSKNGKSLNPSDKLFEVEETVRSNV